MCWKAGWVGAWCSTRWWAASPVKATITDWALIGILIAIGIGIMVAVSSGKGATTCAHFPGSYGHEAQDAATFAVGNPQPAVSTALDHVFSN